jgi:hypothetical protein
LSGWRPAYYKVAWRRDPEICKRASRDAILAALAKEQVDIGAGFRGFSIRGPARCRRFGELTHSRSAGENTMLLHHGALLGDDAAIDRIAAAFRKVDESIAN